MEREESGDGVADHVQLNTVYSRPGYGLNGRPIRIALNHYKVDRAPIAKIHQYNVMVDNGGASRALQKKLWHHEKLQSVLGPARDYVLYDGASLAWSVHPIQFDSEMDSFLEVDIDLDEEKRVKPKRPCTHHVSLRRAGEIDLHVVEAFITKQRGGDNSVILGVNFYDHLLREMPSRRFITTKRSFFQNKSILTLEGGVEAWKGIFQSVRPTLGALSINVDMATCVFWSTGLLLDSVLRLVGLTSPDQLATRLSIPADPVRRELRKLKKLGFKIKHRGVDAEYLKYSVEGVTDMGANKYECKVIRDSVPTTISLEQYYLEVYSYRIKFPALPLIRTRFKGVVFPMELCHIYEGQRYGHKLNEKQTTDMIRFTAQRPNERRRDIQRNVEVLGWSRDPYLNAYGMEISIKMTETSGRLLSTPKIIYGSGSRETVMSPREGKWNLQGQRLADVRGVGLCRLTQAGHTFVVGGHGHGLTTAPA